MTLTIGDLFVLVSGLPDLPAVPAGAKREAADGGYDLIVMGSRGLGLPADQRDFLGSVTERVLRMVPGAVLTVKS